MGKKLEIEVGMDEKKFHLPTLRKSVRELVDIEPKGKKAPELAKLILRHFMDQETEKLTCDSCGGISDESCPCCPYCGQKDAEEQAQVVLVPEKEVPTEESLDASIRSISKSVNELVQGFRQSVWDLGIELSAVKNSRSYLVRYKSFTEFVEKNFEFKETFAFKVMKVTESFDRERVETTAVSALFKLLGETEKAEKPKVKREREQTSVVLGGDGGSTEITAIEVADMTDPGSAGESTTTMVVKTGKKVIRLYTGRGKEPPPAQTLDDRPWGMIQTENRVNLYFTLVRDKTGLKIYMEEEREGLS